MSSARSALAVGLISLIRPSWHRFRTWSVRNRTYGGRTAGLEARCARTSTIDTSGEPMDIVLIAGLWLDGSAWDDVLPELEALGHRGIAVTLPGQGDGTSSATYDDQAAAVVEAVDATEGQPFVVGHSAASTLAW